MNTLFAINGSFRPQRVTGQQRYATEIANRLLSQVDVREIPLPPWASRSDLTSWAYSQTLPYRLNTRELLLTLTSRGPITCRRQVMVVHDLFAIEHPEFYSRSYSSTHGPILRMQLRSAASFVAVSEPTANALREFIGPDALIAVAPNAPSEVFRATESENDSSVLQARGLPPDSYFLAIGTADPRKNLTTLFTAYSALPDRVKRAHPMVWVGGASHHFRNDSQLDLTEIVATGYVSDEELAVLYRHSLLVCVPSIAEGFGLPIVEALASGASVAMSDIPIFRWVASGSGIYVDPRNAEQWAAVLYAAASTPPTRPLGTRRFTWGESANIVMDLLRRSSALGS